MIYNYIKALVIAILAMNPSMAQQTTESVVETVKSHFKNEEAKNIYLKVTYDLSDQQLVDFRSKLLAKGVQVKFENISRNEANYISKISMNIRIDDYSETIISDNNGNAIDEPLIFYFIGSEGIFGTSKGLPSSLKKSERDKFNNFTGLIIGTFF